MSATWVSLWQASTKPWAKINIISWQHKSLDSHFKLIHIACLPEKEDRISPQQQGIDHTHKWTSGEQVHICSLCKVLMFSFFFSFSLWVYTLPDGVFPLWLPLHLSVCLPLWPWHQLCTATPLNFRAQHTASIHTHYNLKHTHDALWNNRHFTIWSLKTDKM